ncbi:MAG: prenyltransferase/squalene oxidase repeat-containing protein [Armatimonadota bacterium]
MLRLFSLIALGCSAVAISMPLSAASAQSAPAGAAVSQRNAQAVRKGLAFLRQKQGQDGSWGQYPGITAVCLIGFLRNGVTEKDPAVAKAVKYLAGLAKPDGAIYTDQFGPAQRLPNYNTALALTALHLTRNPAHRETIRKAQAFLAKSQFDEGEGYTRKDSQYGGIGYGSRADNPDVSNLQNALEALKESGYPRNSEVFQKAILFLQRCQNRSESNDQQWAGNDGGFVYASSGESKADEYTKQPHSSYGSMTYAGLKSYLYANVSKTDPRVQAAWSWLRANWDVEQNPRMKDDGLYYYYHTMTKTLNVWGQKVVTDSRGKKHPWAQEVSAAIVRRQRPDGSWVNQNPRWWENRAELSTGYSLISLANCKQSL